MSKHVTQPQMIIERVVLDWFRSGECELTTTQRMVLLSLSRFCNKETLVSWPKQRIIGVMSSVSRTTVNRAIQVLVETKVITSVQAPGSTNTYDLTPMFDLSPPDTPVLRSRRQDVPVDDTDVAQEHTTNGAVNGAKRTVFKKPTAEEVQSYLDEIGCESFTGEEFIDANDTKGWVVGKFQTPMKNWKAAVRTWIRNRKTWGERDADYRKKELAAIRKEESDGD